MYSSSLFISSFFFEVRLRQRVLHEFVAYKRAWFIFVYISGVWDLWGGEYNVEERTVTRSLGVPIYGTVNERFCSELDYIRSNVDFIVNPAGWVCVGGYRAPETVQQLEYSQWVLWFVRQLNDSSHHPFPFFYISFLSQHSSSFKRKSSLWTYCTQL